MTVRVRGLTCKDYATAEGILRQTISKLDAGASHSDDYIVSIVPLRDHESELVAILDFKHGLPAFLSDLKANPLGNWQTSVDDLEEELSFDTHFHGFTQLYMPDKSSEIAAECVNQLHLESTD